MRRTSPSRLYDAHVFDMDDAIYLGNDLLPGAKQLIEGLRELDRPVRFLSGNLTKNPQLYLEKLRKLGVPAPIEEIVNIAVITVRQLRASHPDAVVFPISEGPLKKALTGAGITMSEDPEEIDIVIASYDRTFEYQKFQITFDAIWFHKRAFLITTSPNRYYPFPDRHDEPDAVTIVTAVEVYTEAKCQVNIGKPEITTLSAAIDGLDADPANCMIVDDRLTTDIGMVIKTNMASCLFLTGDSTLEETEALNPADQPTLVLGRTGHFILEAVRLKQGWSSADE